MKKLSIIVLSFLLIACNQDEIIFDSKECSVSATVRDLTGLDGCGFVFELSDGSRLEPIRLFYCGTPPLPKEVTEDPLFDFQFVDGKKVRIGYEDMAPQYASICMVGKMVKITCVEEVAITEE